jgi:hypothetical protein
MAGMSARVFGLLAVLGAVWACAPRPAQGAAPLLLERTIPLPGVAGRIDHLAIDVDQGRLFVAELGNGSVEAIDLASGRSLGRVGGLKEPQGVGYVPQRDEIVVATGGDGMARFYHAGDLKLAGELKLGEDADDVRVERATGRVFVGYGASLAVIGPAHDLVRLIPMPAHPEGFHVEQDRAYVNLPGAGVVGVLNLAQGREVARWPNPGPRFNYPMAIERQVRQVAVVYRFPAKLVIFDAKTGGAEEQLDTCGDADDVFFNRTDNRLYVICGGGAVDVFERLRTGYARAGRIDTRSGARTGLYAERLDRLFVAAPARGGKPAAILVFRPGP